MKRRTLLVISAAAVACSAWLGGCSKAPELPETQLPTEGTLWLQPNYGQTGTNWALLHYYAKDSQCKLDIGLRADGVVVWRKHE
jgi:hypothetical protein